MNGRWFLRFAAGCAVILLARGTARAADEKSGEAEKVRVQPRNFYRNYLAPRVDSGLLGETTAAIDYTNPAANPWTRDRATVHRVELSVVQAGKNALKRYVVESLGIDKWSIPLFQTGKAGLFSAPAATDARASLRFGFCHLAPRAELAIPAAYGRVALSADARGAVAASFESHSYTFRVDVGFDPREHTGTFTLGRRF